MLALSHPQVTDLMQQSFRHACHISTNAQLQMANTPDCYPIPSALEKYSLPCKQKLAKHYKTDHLHHHAA